MVTRSAPGRREAGRYGVRALLGTSQQNQTTAAPTVIAREEKKKKYAAAQSSMRFGVFGIYLNSPLLLPAGANGDSHHAVSLAVTVRNRSFQTWRRSPTVNGNGFSVPERWPENVQPPHASRARDADVQCGVDQCVYLTGLASCYCSYYHQPVRLREAVKRDTSRPTERRS